jgi:hypothetical protein
MRSSSHATVPINTPEDPAAAEALAPAADSLSGTGERKP